MWEWEYAKEPFDLKLFVYHIVHNLKWILLAAAAGVLLIGGGYYLKNVTLGSRIPYEITNKFYVEYAQDPKDSGQTYTYINGYAWNDWVKSDELVTPILSALSVPMTKEELIDCYEATLPADLRIPYVTVTYVDREVAEEISSLLVEQVLTFGENQREIESIRLIDTVGPALQVRDIRTLRACILGAVVGTFFALLLMGFHLILAESAELPEQLSCRYGIPAAGYVDLQGKVSEECREQIAYLYAGRQNIGVTAVEASLDLRGVSSLLPQEKNYVNIPGVLQVPESAKALRAQDGVLLLVEADNRNGKAIQTVLQFMKDQDIQVQAFLLVGADRRLIRYYRCNLSLRRGKKGEES